MNVENADMPAMPIVNSELAAALEIGANGAKGLTKRETFALNAMQGLLANSGGVIQANSMSGTGWCNTDAKGMAELAVNCADSIAGGVREMSELKKCPFCGGEAKQSLGLSAGFAEVYIECDNDLCVAAPCVSDGDIQSATTAWNTRPPMQDCAEEMYELLEEIAEVYGEFYYLKTKINQLLAKARGEL